MPLITALEAFKIGGGPTFQPGQVCEVSERVARIAIRRKWAVAGERIVERRDGVLSLRFEFDERCFVNMGEQELVEHFGIEFYKELYALGKAAAERIAAKSMIGDRDAAGIAELFGVPVELINPDGVEHREDGDAAN